MTSIPKSFPMHPASQLRRETSAQRRTSIVGHARRAHPMRRKLLPLILSACFSPAIAWAAPSGHSVVHGNVSVEKVGNVLTVVNTPGAIINWQSFSINAGDITRFVQQHADSSVLNRVIGQHPSHILGALESNGRVFLINPNGILFGQGATVDVNGLVASTLHLSNENFLAGRMQFEGGGLGNIKNEGSITTAKGGQVYLIAPSVENSGVIKAPNGDVLLAAGHSVHLVDSANPALQVVLSAPENQALNVGEIVVQSGRASVYGALVRQRGLVSANSVEVGAQGKIVFKAAGDTFLEAGSVTSATGAGQGGSIAVLGQRVGLVENAQLDASGKQGGGTILVGGDFQGKNAQVNNAQYTFVGHDVSIKADALENGNGGKVIVWADDTTRAFGSISAKGGAQAGDGGFVEVSGKESLQYAAHTDTTAAAGRKGTLLLDPRSITIIGSYCEEFCEQPPDPGFGGHAEGGDINVPGSIFYSDEGPSYIYESQIEAQSQSADIILEAHRSISTEGRFIDDDVRLAAGSNLILRTRNNSTSDNIPDYGGGIFIAGEANELEFRTSGSGTITIEVGTAGELDNVSLVVGKLATDGGDIALSSSGSIDLQGEINAGAGKVSLVAGTDIWQYSEQGIVAGTLRADAVQVRLDADNAVGVLAGTARGGDFIYRSRGQLVIGTVDGVSGVRLEPGEGQGEQLLALLSFNDDLGQSGISQQAGADIDTGEGILATVITGGGDVTLTNATNRIGSFAATLQGGNLSLTTSESLSVASAYGAPGDFSDVISGIDTTGGNVTLRAVSGNMSLDQTIYADDGTVNLQAAGAIVTLDEGAYIVADTLTLTAGNGIDAVTEAASLTATNHDVDGASGITIQSRRGVTLQSLRQTGNGGDITVATNGEALQLDQADVVVAGAVEAGTGDVTFNVQGAISGGGLISGAAGSFAADFGVNLRTALASLSVTNAGFYDTDIVISNTGVMRLNAAQQIEGAGRIDIVNYGAFTVGDVASSASNPIVRTHSGAISLVANSPLDIYGPVSSDSGNINLVASANNSPNDNLGIYAPVTTGGNVSLSAGGTIIGLDYVQAGGAVTPLANQNPALSGGADAGDLLATTLNNASDSTLDLLTESDDEDDEALQVADNSNDSGSDSNDANTKLYCN